MKVQRLAAFSFGNVGGNPAGVVVEETLPSAAEMQRIAAEVGYCETAFAAPLGDQWQVRYFSPEAEIPFCGHATIALGAALAESHGDGVYRLSLNEAEITVEGSSGSILSSAALQSPPTSSRSVESASLSAALDLFGLTPSALDERIPPALVNAGADHLVLMLKSRAALSRMKYDFEAGKILTRKEGWVTVLLGHVDDLQKISTRNAFAYGGVYEDPATGASSAALAGYLRELGWPHGGEIDVLQGDDMGVPCRIKAQMTAELGSSVRLSGTVRHL